MLVLYKNRHPLQVNLLHTHSIKLLINNDIQQVNSRATAAKTPTFYVKKNNFLPSNPFHQPFKTPQHNYSAFCSSEHVTAQQQYANTFKLINAINNPPNTQPSPTHPTILTPQHLTSKYITAMMVMRAPLSNHPRPQNSQLPAGHVLFETKRGVHRCTITVSSELCELLRAYAIGMVVASAPPPPPRSVDDVHWRARRPR